MGQKGSHPDQQQINEYYQKRHSFMENPEERKARAQRDPGYKSKHKKSKSKDLTANK